MPRPELSTLRYPHLWQGCVGAWCPSQSGATGYRLFDDSGNGNHGTLTNMDPGTDWVPSGGKLALDFDGVDDQVAVTQPQYTYPITVNLWVRATTSHNAYLVNFTATGLTGSLGFVSGQADIRYGGFQWQVGSLSVDVLSKWPMVTYVLASQESRSVYINGMLAGTHTTSATFPVMSALRFGGQQFESRRLIGQLDDIRIYNRALAPYEIRQLASYRGAAYERSRGRKKAYVPGYRITAPSRIQTGSARTIDGTDTESLSRGLVGCWVPSLGASGFRLIDRSGNNNHGVLTNMDPGTDWVPSGGKLALDFDGTDDYVSASFPAIELSTQNGSISAWVRTPNATSGVLVGLNNASDFDPFFNIVGSSPVVGTRNDLGGDLFTVTGGAFTSEWRLLTVVSTPTRTTLYQNGVVVNSVTQSSTATRTYNRFSFAVNNRAGSLSGFGACLVDDARVYNRILTPNEIRLLYTGGRGVGLLPEVKPKRARIVAWDNQDKISVPARVLTNTDSLKRGLVGHWSPSVSGPQGNRLMDLSGQNNHGTLTNMDYQTDYVPNAEKGGRMALDFDGVNDTINAPMQSLAYPITMSFWVQASTPKNSYCLVLNSSETVYISLGFTSDGTNWNTDIRINGVAYNTAVIAAVGDFPSGFIHLAGVFESETVRRVYLNGQFKTAGNSNSATIPQINNARIGGGIGVRNLQGQLDDVRIYNRALTPNEIRLLAQSRMPERATPQRTRTVFYSSGLISYLRRRSYNSILGSGVLS